jgi:CP family cyanate transporter-like MFS transporter
MIGNTSPHRRWWVLASLWMLYASFGLVAGSLAPLLSHIRNDLNMSHAAMGAALGAWPFVYLAVSAVVGKLLDRVGVRVGLALGAALIGASGLLRGAAQSGTGLWFAVAVFGLGGPFISIGAPKLVTQWFTSEERGLAVGVYSSAPSVGSIVGLVAADPLRILFGGWRWVMVTFACASLLSGLFWISVGGSNSDVAMHSSQSESRSGLWADPTVRRILVLAFMIFFVGHALTGWMPEMLHSGLWSTRGAAWLTATGLGMGVIGSLLIPGRVAPRSRSQVLVAMFGAMAVAVWALAITPQLVQVVAVAIIGIVRVSSVPMAMLLLMSAPRVSDVRMGAAAGLFFTAGELGGVTGPWFIGIARQNSVDFVPAVAMLSLVALVSAVACWRFTRSGFFNNA